MEMGTKLDDGRPLSAHACVACMEGNLARLQELFQSLSSKDDIEELLYCNSWPKSMTLLLMAASMGHLSIVKYLVEQGASVNDNGTDPKKSPAEYQSDEGTSCKAPVHVAAMQGHLSVVRYLVQNGAQTYMIDRNQSTMMHLACIAGHLDVVRYCVEESGMAEEPYTLSLCLNHADMFGGTGISWASRQGNLEVVQYLKAKGADSTKRDKEGKSPLDHARESGHQTIVVALQEK